jgi:MFS family permease
MYALSPLTGYLSDRLGRIPVILIGVALLIGSAFLAANTPGDETARLTVALFLLGLGWNFGFVAGSALLTDSVPEIDRVRAQGSADSLTWLSAAAASLASGVLLGQGGFTLLSTVGAGFAVIPVLVIARHRIRPR